MPEEHNILEKDNNTCIKVRDVVKKDFPSDPVNCKYLKTKISPTTISLKQISIMIQHHIRNKLFCHSY